MLGLGNSIIQGTTLSGISALTDISDLSIWLKNGTGVAVEQWDDSSGNNNHVTQSTSGEQATVTGGGLQFEGDNNDHYDLTTGIDIGASNPWTIFIVLNMQSYDSQNTILSKASGGNALFLEMQQIDQIRYRQSSTSAVLKFGGTEHFPLSSKYLITIRKDSSRELFVYKNGSLLTQSSSTGNPVASGAFTADQFGGRSTSPDRDFDGIVYEFALYEKDLSTEELSNVHAYLTSIHGL